MCQGHAKLGDNPQFIGILRSSSILNLETGRACVCDLYIVAVGNIVIFSEVVWLKLEM